MTTSLKKKLVTAILYALPVAFFMVAIFGLTATGEDIVQGAGRWRNGEEINIWNDISASFQNNARLTDMYAWTVADFFDYQFQFGIDIIPRALDVLMAAGIFYLMTFIILGRRPKLVVKDAVISLLMFIAVILTPHGRVLYAGFATLHNYMIGAFIVMLFFLPYSLAILQKRTYGRYFWLLMLALGIMFGMLAVILPLAFLLTILGYVIIARWRKQKVNMPAWALAGIIGVVVGASITNLFGPGMGNYVGIEIYTTTYDYLSLADIFASFPSSIVKILQHLGYNFVRVLLPIAILIATLIIFSRQPKQYFTKQFYCSISKERCRLVLVGVSFAVLAILMTFQVNAPLRALLPTYLVLIVCVTGIYGADLRVKLLCPLLTTVAVAILCVKSALTVQYYTQSWLILDEVRSAETDVICISPERAKATNLPLAYLGQEDMLMDWAMPETIYGKTVSSSCEI